MSHVLREQPRLILLPRLRVSGRVSTCILSETVGARSVRSIIRLVKPITRSILILKPFDSRLDVRRLVLKCLVLIGSAGFLRIVSLLRGLKLLVSSGEQIVGVLSDAEVTLFSLVIIHFNIIS